MHTIDPPGFKACAPADDRSIDPIEWAVAFVEANEADPYRVALWFRNAMRAAHQAAPSNIDGFEETLPPSE